MVIHPLPTDARVASDSIVAQELCDSLRALLRRADPAQGRETVRLVDEYAVALRAATEDAASVLGASEADRPAFEIEDATLAILEGMLACRPLAARTGTAIVADLAGAIDATVEDRRALRCLVVLSLLRELAGAPAAIEITAYGSTEAVLVALLVQERMDTSRLARRTDPEPGLDDLARALGARLDPLATYAPAGHHRLAFEFRSQGQWRPSRLAAARLLASSR